MDIGGLMLRHYSHRPIDVIQSVEQRGRSDYKPRGLWVSADGTGEGWADWCELEQFSGGWTHIYDVHLSEGANLVHLSAVEDLDRFHDRFRSHDPWPYDGQIDWRAVASKWDGIIISPYLWERRFGAPASRWYYGWDCASGCIWSAGAIASLTPAKVTVP